MHRLATIADAALVARITIAGFWDDPVMRWLFPDESTYADRMAWMFHGLAADYPPERGEVLLDGEAAVALWRRPGFAHHDPGDDPGSGGVPPVTSDELVRMGELGAGMAAAHPTEPHWYLNVVSTIPERQGQGLGAALLAPTLAQADADGLGCYLESSNPRNRSLYRRLGFVQTADSVLGPDAPSLAPMWREPQPS